MKEKRHHKVHLITVIKLTTDDLNLSSAKPSTFDHQSFDPLCGQGLKLTSQTPQISLSLT